MRKHRKCLVWECWRRRLHYIWILVVQDVQQIQSCPEQHYCHPMAFPAAASSWSLLSCEASVVRLTLQTCGSGVYWGRRPNCFPYHFPKGHAMLHTRDKSTTCLFSNRWFSPAHLNVETEVLLSWPGITPGWHHEGIKHCSLSMLAKYHTLGVLFPAPAKPWSHGWASSPMNPAPFGFSR